MLINQSRVHRMYGAWFASGAPDSQARAFSPGVRVNGSPFP
jgi:hypothetical protein